MSSSGLIYAVIVGAWAAYLVPMWLRRQDELNEARPTERFSTAIRLLSGRAAMERRYAKDQQARPQEADGPPGDPDEPTDSVDVRSLAVPATVREPRPARTDGTDSTGDAGHAPGAGTGDGWRAEEVVPGVGDRDADDGAENGTEHAEHGEGAEEPAGRVPARRVPARRPATAEAVAHARRSKVLARRRRTTVVLFVAFTLGAVGAAVGGVPFLWAPAVPAVLLSAYIAHLRARERRRFAYTMDRRRAEAAARQLRERRSQGRSGADRDPTAERAASPGAPPATGDHREPPAAPGRSALAADRRALVEQTDHAEWVDQQRERRRRPGPGDSWDPVPVPLPTYVTAPVAPRAGSDIDLGAPGTWSSARSSAARPPTDGRRAARGDRPADLDGHRNAPRGVPHAPDPQDAPHAPGTPGADTPRRGTPRGARERGRTPLFDQQADDDHPRASGQ